MLPPEVPFQQNGAGFNQNGRGRGGKNFLMCTDCAKHVPALQYLQENHDAKSGWNNLHFLRGAFGSEAYKAMCAPISVTTCNSNVLLHEATDDETRYKSVASDETDSIQIWPAQTHHANIEPYMAVNGVEIGRAAVPSELVRVTYMGRSVFVQILYDEGSQITLVNRFCEPLIMNTRKTQKPVKISGEIGESFEIRKILKLYLKDYIQLEGILVPFLKINPITVKRPNCLKEYDGQWAIPINDHYSGNVIAQILLGTDAAQYLPVAVTTAEGFPIQTARARLKRSIITGKYILFGSADENDQLIHTRFPSEKGADVQTFSCTSKEEHCQFTYPDLSDGCFLSSEQVEIIDIGTDSEADEEPETEK